VLFRSGWDEIREQRWNRQKQLGIPRSTLGPRDEDVYPYWNLSEAGLRQKIDPNEVGRALPWKELTEAQRQFQATKMAIHAAMVERMDREIGRVLDQLRSMGAFENTVVLFASDNGASAEQIVRGDLHDASAPPGSGPSYLCLGPGWSTAANTPMRLHKSWVHEGGIATPLIVHWPAGIRARGELRRGIGHVIDIAPTLVELAGGVAAPAEQGPPLPGRSLAAAFARDVPVHRDALYFHHDSNRALRLGDWKIVSRRPETNRWSLYRMDRDRGETKDLAESHPRRVRAMGALWRKLEDTYRGQPGPAAK
jgi:arylsulfatase